MMKMSCCYYFSFRACDYNYSSMPAELIPPCHKARKAGYPPQSMADNGDMVHVTVYAAGSNYISQTDPVVA